MTKSAPPPHTSDWLLLPTVAARAEVGGEVGDHVSSFGVGGHLQGRNSVNGLSKYQKQRSCKILHFLGKSIKGFNVIDPLYL